LRQVGQEQVRILSVIRDGLMNADEILKAQLDTLSKWYPEMRTVLEEHTLSLKSLPNVLQGPIQMLTTTLENQLDAVAQSVDRLVETNFNEQFMTLTAALNDQERQLGNSTAAVRELAQITRSVLECQAALERSVSQLHELGFEKALSALRETLAALGPILDGFRRPFVLQAVQLDLVNPPAGQASQQGAA
jgi:ABC-type transporter Mla subunit MlaD